MYLSLSIKFAIVDEVVLEDFRHYWDKFKDFSCEVLVVDGPPRDVFKVHKEAWSNCRHIPVDSPVSVP